MLIIYLCIFFLGASLASFLNASIYRVENKYKYPTIITAKSHCEKCKKELCWLELIPVIGYLIIKGRCRNCNEKINIYYPLSEFVLGLIFLLFFLYSITWYFWIVALFLFIFSSYDIKYKAIPKDIVHIFLFLSTLLFYIYILNPVNLYFPFVITLFLILLNLIKKSFGMGDILVLLGLGILIPYQQYIFTFWGGIIVALLYTLYLLFKGVKNIKKVKISMIPFFSFSFVISLIYGYELFDILLKFLKI
ncbi:MAG: prepilin peptidase [Candidatus Dojkabacteria bacterium]